MESSVLRFKPQPYFEQNYRRDGSYPTFLLFMACAKMCSDTISLVVR